MKRILLTGAGGGVGKMIRPMLRQRYRLRLSDVMPIGHDETEEFVLADLGDFDAIRKAVRGVDGIIHLGGNSQEADFPTILQANIVGTYNVFEAARLESVARVVYASSNHVVGFYPRTQTIPVGVTLRPDSRYGVSKMFGEGLASLYADKYGVATLTIRIGRVLPKPGTLRDLAVWLSPRDLVQLIEIGLETTGLRHEIVYGISDNQRGWWDMSNAARLGYRPSDRSEDYAAEALAKGDGATGNPIVDLHQGGVFCAAEAMVPVPPT